MTPVPADPLDQLPLKYASTIRRMLEAALDSVDPEKCVSRFIVKNPDLFSGKEYQLIAIGKAAAAMSRGAVAVLGKLVKGGIIVTKYPPDQDLDPQFEIILSGHPNPNQMSIEASKQIQRFVEVCEPQQQIICLISGGGSALVVQPIEGITLEDYAGVNQALLDHHLPIEAVNTIRKSLDQFKGGGLAEWMDGKAAITLILSDVVSNILEQVASGPTFPVKNRSITAIQLLRRYRLVQKIDPKVFKILRKNAKFEAEKQNDHSGSRPKPVPTFAVGDLEIAKQAAKLIGTRDGYDMVIHKQPLRCSVENASKSICSVIRKELNRKRFAIHIWGGEVTVHAASKGSGGRNTHLALLVMDDMKEETGYGFISFATDGDDGNSHSSGALVSSKTYTNSMQRCFNTEYYLNNYCSAELFEQLGALIKTGPTGTNVNDLYIAILSNEI